MTEKVLNTIQLTMGNGPKGHFEYEIHHVINEGIKQYRLRLWDYKDRLRVRFAKTVGELEFEANKLLKESLA